MSENKLSIEQQAKLESIQGNAMKLAGKWISKSVDLGLVPTRWEKCDLLTQLVQDQQHGILDLKLGVAVPIDELVAIIVLSRSTSLEQTHRLSFATALFDSALPGYEEVRRFLQNPLTRSIGISQIFVASMEPKYPQDNYLKIGQSTTFQFASRNHIQTQEDLLAIERTYNDLNRRPPTDFTVLYAEEYPWSWNTR
ncbi:hypothetical protein KBD81_02785 [Candidatus Woesebacteria bacterium]|nr:hypothetical protein [Candidatus Woesebacteria bacterium]